MILLFLITWYRNSSNLISLLQTPQLSIIMCVVWSTNLFCLCYCDNLLFCCRYVQYFQWSALWSHQDQQQAPVSAPRHHARDPKLRVQRRWADMLWLLAVCQWLPEVLKAGFRGSSRLPLLLTPPCQTDKHAGLLHTPRVILSQEVSAKYRCRRGPECFVIWSLKPESEVVRNRCDRIAFVV